MKNRNQDNIDKKEYRKRFHKYAYENKQKERKRKPSASIADILTHKHSSDTYEQFKPKKTLQDSQVKTASQLIKELLDLEDIADPIIQNKTYEIPTHSYQEAHDKRPEYNASPEKKASPSSSIPIEPIDWKTAYHLAEDFTELFSPWRGCYKILTVDGWRQIQRKLKFKSICKAIQGRATLAFYSPIHTTLLGIDIDDHSEHPSDSNISDKCIHEYREVIQKMGCPPSLVSKSPRGLHLFYLLTTKIHSKNLHLLARDVLQKAEVELLPSRENTIRIPSVPNLRDSTTLESLAPDHPLCSDWSSLPLYHLEDIFGPEWKERLHTLNREYLQPRIASAGAVSSDNHSDGTSLSLRLLEKKYMPLRNGDTHWPIFKLTIACMKEGMDRDEIIDYLYRLLELSPSYRGDLKIKPKILEDRVDHILENSTSFSEVNANYNPAILTELQPVIDHLARIHPFAPQRNKPVKQFIKKLILWKSFHDRIIQDLEETAKFEELYPFYRKNRREGYYPLPASLLKRWHPKYYELVHWLEEIEVLQASPYPYSKSAHICKYYSISFEHLEP